MDFISTFLGTFAATLLGNMWKGREAKATRHGWEIIRAGKGPTKARQDF